MSLQPEQFPNDEPVPQAPPDVAWLREARERKGLTLDALASTTKITPKYLRRWRQARPIVAATFFTRSFAKAYAKEVGLDPAEPPSVTCSRSRPTALPTRRRGAIVATAVARTGGVAFEQDDTAHLHQGPGQNRVGR